MYYVGILWLPFQECNYQLHVEAMETGMTGGREAAVYLIARDRWPAMRIGVVTGWEPRVGAGTSGDFILRKPVRTAELLAQVASEM